MAEEDDDVFTRSDYSDDYFSDYEFDEYVNLLGYSELRVSSPPGASDCLSQSPPGTSILGSASGLGHPVLFRDKESQMGYTQLEPTST
eukprot:CAMPEP_0194749746 /NCGR_PEP_ID=MMETSP0323_2-20130528/3851_1 /TAXON_ID=2866 ORGANISM="Crypthecodinium cohnii, Strain Seligo" /NCGR_SAMPLE_ID=MMETSP0323_2 /ASSEMBLY_ACC=CAM_ASM_000346 /LENGTH=87 /DNA_ID=CAMNT_0039664985 /DNA_START=162 /DNA_END=424 /DNA_ORIENTATION=-